MTILCEYQYQWTISWILLVEFDVNNNYHHYKYMKYLYICTLSSAVPLPPAIIAPAWPVNSAKKQHQSRKKLSPKQS